MMPKQSFKDVVNVLGGQEVNLEQTHRQREPDSHNAYLKFEREKKSSESSDLFMVK